MGGLAPHLNPAEDVSFLVRGCLGVLDHDMLLIMVCCIFKALSKLGPKWRLLATAWDL